MIHWTLLRDKCYTTWSLTLRCSLPQIKPRFCNNQKTFMSNQDNRKKKINKTKQTQCFTFSNNDIDIVIPNTILKNYLAQIQTNGKKS